mgnify:FL=1
MENILNNLAAALNALAYYFVSAISLIVSNKYFLGITILLLLFAGKSLKIGRLISAKG